MQHRTATRRHLEHQLALNLNSRQVKHTANYFYDGLHNANSHNNDAETNAQVRRDLFFPARTAKLNVTERWENVC